jgi:hypothetical protein
MANHPNPMTIIVVVQRARPWTVNKFIKITSSFITLQNTVHVNAVYIH